MIGTALLAWKHPVTWKPRRGITSPALAIPCATCGATIGQPCSRHYGGGEPMADPHAQRAETAEEFGFRFTPGQEPASTAEPEAAPEPDPAQPSLFAP